jgi:hypothetical protein
MFVLFELLLTEHLGAAFRALQIVGAVYLGVVVVTWGMALFHPEQARREWAHRLFEDLLELPRVVARFLSGRGGR